MMKDQSQDWGDMDKLKNMITVVAETEVMWGLRMCGFKTET